MYAEDVRRPEGGQVSTETIGDLFDTIVTKPATVLEDATLQEAVNAILDSGITRKAYVVDAEGRLKGTITMESLMRQAGYRLGVRAPGIISWFRFIGEMSNDKARDVMTKPVPVTKGTLVTDIVRRVVEEHLNDFPVVDDEGKLIGELNTYNLLKATRDVFKEPKSEGSS